MNKLLLGDYLEFDKGISVPRDRLNKDYDIPYLHYGDVYKIYNTAVNLEKEYKTILKVKSSEKYKESQLLKNGDIVYNLTSETINDLGKSVCIKNIDNKKFIAGMETTIVRIKDKNKILPEYLNYIFSTEKFKKMLRQYVTGMKVYRVHPRDISRIELSIPEIDEQKQSIRILEALDDKIELNNQMNKTLEEMAQVLYKQWFVDFEFPNENGKPYKSSGGEMVESELGLIPKGWEVKELGELHEYGVLVMGNSPKSETYNEDGIGLPLINGASDYNELEIKAKKYTSAPSRVCGKGDYIFGVRATIGNVKISDDKYAIGRGVGALTNILNDKKAYMYFVLKNAFKQLELSATGSVYASISKPDLLTLKIFKVENSVIEQFSEISNVLFDKKHLLLNEQKELFEVKTNLLNKLI